MKSSSISLLYVPGAVSRPDGYGLRGLTAEERRASGFLINLIDSPGHVDFCSEVSTAARLSDGALVLVDAVEGVCIQTHAVLRQAFEERVVPTLFINKIDRLVRDLHLDAEEAYDKMSKIVMDCNHIWSQLESEAFLQYDHDDDDHDDHDHVHDGDGDNNDNKKKVHSRDQVHEDAFRPSAGNVAFGSAVEGWAFTLPTFAHLFASKLGASPTALTQALWGDFYFYAKEKKVVGAKKGSALGLRPMFVQFCLDPIWRIYTTAKYVIHSRNTRRTTAMANENYVTHAHAIHINFYSIFLFPPPPLHLYIFRLLSCEYIWIYNPSNTCQQNFTQL